jgi:fructose-1,6-bisphosphatase/sedoheptulose 1,7-bisphosphatase-like protein
MAEYADVLWDGCSVSESDLLEHVQYQSAKVVTGAMQVTSKSRLLEELAWEDLKTRRYMQNLFCISK